MICASTSTTFVIIKYRRIFVPNFAHVKDENQVGNKEIIVCAHFLRKCSQVASNKLFLGRTFQF